MAGVPALVAVMDWKTRAVISWKLSNIMDSNFCVEALQLAFAGTGTAPGPFNTDQGSQFTSAAWVSTVEEVGTKVSMDGEGRWIDNMWIEQLWQAVKHDGVYLWADDNLHDLERALTRWFKDYDEWKSDKALDGKTLRECYHQSTNSLQFKLRTQRPPSN